jgi:hypothetical protein
MKGAIPAQPKLILRLFLKKAVIFTSAGTTTPRIKKP